MNLRLSPSPLDPLTHLRTRGPVDHTLPVTVIVTVLLRDTRFVTHNYNRHRLYSTHPVRGPDVHRERPSTVDSTVTNSQIRVGVRGSSSRDYGIHHPIQPVKVLGSGTRDDVPTSSLQSNPPEYKSGTFPFSTVVGTIRSHPVGNLRTVSRTDSPPSSSRLRDGDLSHVGMSRRFGRGRSSFTYRESTGSGPPRTGGRDHRHRTWIITGVGPTSCGGGSTTGLGSPLSSW